MPKYKAVMFAPDGDWVTDYYGRDTIEEVEEMLADQGSRWFFYPFAGVIYDRGNYTSKRQKLVRMESPFEYLENRTIATCAKEIGNTPNEVLQAILEG